MHLFCFVNVLLLLLLLLLLLKKQNDLSQLTHVQMTALDAAGFTADIVSCDDTSHCVCAQERLEWPLGLCMNPDDVVNALKHLSLACGLPADF